MGLPCLFVQLVNLNWMLGRLQVLLGLGLHRMLNSLLAYTPTATTTDVHARVFSTLQSLTKSYPDDISCHECLRFASSGALDMY